MEPPKVKDFEHLGDGQERAYRQAYNRYTAQKRKVARKVARVAAADARADAQHQTDPCQQEPVTAFNAVQQPIDDQPTANSDHRNDMETDDAPLPCFTRFHVPAVVPPAASAVSAPAGLGQGVDPSLGLGGGGVHRPLVVPRSAGSLLVSQLLARRQHTEAIHHEAQLALQRLPFYLHSEARSLSEMVRDLGSYGNVAVMHLLRTHLANPDVAISLFVRRYVDALAAHRPDKFAEADQLLLLQQTADAVMDRLAQHHRDALLQRRHPACPVCSDPGPSPSEVVAAANVSGFTFRASV